MTPMRAASILAQCSVIAVAIGCGTGEPVQPQAEEQTAVHFLPMRNPAETPVTGPPWRGPGALRSRLVSRQLLPYQGGRVVSNMQVVQILYGGANTDYPAQVTG